MRETVLVIGGAGLIDSHLVDRLVNSVHSFRVINNPSMGDLPNIENHIESCRVDFIKSGTRDAELVKKTRSRCLRSGSSSYNGERAFFCCESGFDAYSASAVGTVILLVSPAAKKISSCLRCWLRKPLSLGSS